MILVTGAAGFSGRRIVARLLAEGERPRGLVRDPAKARAALPQGVEVVAGDTTQPATLDAALAGVDTVIHTAFITADRKQGPTTNYQAINVGGTRNLVAAAQRAGVQRIVVLSGLGTKPDKPGSYMQGRWEAQEMVKHSGMAWSILGPSIQFGEGSAFFLGLANLIRTTPLVVPMIGDGKRQFQPVFVEDTARALVTMARQPQAYDGRVIEIGGPDIFTYAQILDIIMDATGKQRIKVPGPTPFVALGAALMNAVLPKPPITPAAVGLFAFENVTAIDSVERNFGFAPQPLKPWVAQHGIR